MPPSRSTFVKLLELIRFSHSVFALPFALLAAVMSWTAVSQQGTVPGFSLLHLLAIVLCMVAARSAAMSFNRLVDWRIDAANPRTSQRHLPTGALSRTAVVAFTVGSGAIFVLGTILFLPNVLPLALSIPVLAFICGYSLSKRFTSLSHFWLGAALMLAPVAVWIALRGEIVQQWPADLLPAIVLGVAVLFWVAGFDMIYACQDAEFDRRSHLHSVPAALGVRGALAVAAACHAVMLLALIALPWTTAIGGPELGLGWLYFAGVIAVALLLIYQHALVRPDDLTRVNIAFFNVNAIISFGVFAVASIDLILV